MLPLVPNTLFHGADYNPDQWFFDPNVFEQDLEFMKETKSNAFSIGMFSWATMEPEEGRYEFDWLETILDRLYENGIYTFLSTPGAARPAWLSQRYPEVLRTDETRRKRLHGERHNHCMTSPAYREKVAQINGKLAERFSEHPGVLLWHINNEYEGHCHCELCQEAFRAWLQRRYGTLDELNYRWWTTFWAHTYTDWSQIESPSSIGENSLHGLKLDWKRFMTDQVADFLRHEIQAVRASSKRWLPAAHNFHDFISLDYNYHVLAQEIDIVAWDNYPLWHHPERTDVREGPMRSFVHDINRTLKHQPYMMFESSPSATNWQNVAKLRRPGLHGLQSMQAIAHGSDSAQYFQWRKSLGSSEKFHGAVVDHYAEGNNRVFREVKAFGEDLARLGEIASATAHADVAILYDWENAWAYNDAEGPLRDKIRYYDACNQHYRAFWEAGITCDIIDLKADLSRYKMVVAPFAYMLPEAFANEVRALVERGGTFVTGVWSGLVDETDLAYRTGRPGPLRDVLGIWVEETDALYPSERCLVLPVDSATTDDNVDNPVYATRLLDLMHLEGAEALWVYGEDFYAGTPAVTKHHYGEGRAYYLGFNTDDDFFLDFYAKLLQDTDLTRNWPSELPLGVSCTRRSHPGSDYLFLLNFNDHEVQFSNPQVVYDLLREETLTVDATITMPPYSYRVLRRNEDH